MIPQGSLTLLADSGIGLVSTWCFMAEKYRLINVSINPKLLGRIGYCFATHNDSLRASCRCAKSWYFLTDDWPSMVMAALMCFFCDGLAGALCHGDGACQRQKSKHKLPEWLRRMRWGISNQWVRLSFSISKSGFLLTKKDQRRWRTERLKKRNVQLLFTLTFTCSNGIRL